MLDIGIYWDIILTTLKLSKSSIQGSSLISGIIQVEPSVLKHQKKGGIFQNHQRARVRATLFHNVSQVSCRPQTLRSPAQSSTLVDVANNVRQSDPTRGLKSQCMAYYGALYGNPHPPQGTAAKLLHCRHIDLFLPGL